MPTIHELFQQEAVDLDPRWQTLYAEATAKASVTNAEDADASDWDAAAARAWARDADLWLVRVPQALQAGGQTDLLFIPLGQRYDVVVRRRNILDGKGLGQNKFDALGNAIQGLGEGAGEGWTQLATWAKVAIGLFAAYLVLSFVKEIHS